MVRKPRTLAVTPKASTRNNTNFKWLSGIMALFLLFTTLVLFSLWRLSAPDTAIPLATHAFAAAVSPQGLDDPVDIDALLDETDGAAELIELFDSDFVTLSRAELAELPPRELRLKVITQFVEPLYWEGIEEVAQQLTDSQAAAEEFSENAHYLSLVSYETHLELRNKFIYSLLATLAALGALVFFSRRFGRLVSPALVVLLAAMPFLLLTLFLSSIPAFEPAAVAEATDDARLGIVLSETAPIISEALLFAFILVVFIVLFTLLLALALRLWKGPLPPKA